MLPLFVTDSFCLTEHPYISSLLCHMTVFTLFKMLTSTIECIGYILFLHPCIDRHLNFLFLLGIVKVGTNYTFSCMLSIHLVVS